MTPLEIGCRILAARKLKREEIDPLGHNLTEAEWKLAVPHVAAIYRELIAHGFELVSDTDRRAGMFDGPARNV